MYLELLLLFSAICFSLYRWWMSNSDFWEKRGIPYCSKNLAALDTFAMLSRRQSFFYLSKRVYFRCTGKFTGMFQVSQPVLIIRDPDLVKKITIKDFDHFMNHNSLLSTDDAHDLFSNGLLQMQNDKWKDMRSTLSPAFTGSKMRIMFHLITEVVDNALEHLKTQNGNEIDFKDFCTRFTNDAIASTAFGLQINSFKNPNNEFYVMARKTSSLTLKQMFLFVIIMTSKKLTKLFNINLFSNESSKYYLDLIFDAMKYRKEHNITRPDMINILMEAKGMKDSEQPKAHNRQWTDVEIAAQCFLFLFGGFETVSTAIIFTAHELVENPDVQEKLSEEIQAVVEQLNGEPLSYDVLKTMKYLDMVVSETLRKWPPNIATDRECNKDIEYELDDGTTLKILKGDMVIFETVGFHHDPQYFPNPEQFDPERFSDENKDKIPQGTYFPFGMGPRICIASRFGLMETKAVIFHLIRDFKIVKSPKTCSPLRPAKSNQLLPENGSFLRFVPRNS